MWQTLPLAFSMLCQIKCKQAGSVFMQMEMKLKITEKMQASTRSMHMETEMTITEKMTVKMTENMVENMMGNMMKKIAKAITCTSNLNINVPDEMIILYTNVMPGLMWMGIFLTTAKKIMPRKTRNVGNATIVVNRLKLKMGRCTTR